MNWKENWEVLKGPAFIALMCLMLFGFMILMAHAMFGERDYSIQDVENWCCAHNDTFSPTGENCTQLVGYMNPMYCTRNISRSIQRT